MFLICTRKYALELGTIPYLNRLVFDIALHQNCTRYTNMI